MKEAITYLLMVVMATVTASMSMAQDVDKIIAKHLKAQGGIENWDKIESMKITGTFTAFSEEDDFMSYKTKDGKYYSELSLGRFDVIEAFDGDEGWTIDPWQDFTYPREVNKHERNVFKQKAEFFTPFYNYKEKGHTVEFVREVKVDGVDVYVLKLNRANGNTETWYLDKKTYLPYKYESYWVDFGYRVISETYFDDYRKVDGVVVPFFSERTFWQRDRILQIDNIEFNTKMCCSKFHMPKSKEIEKLSFLPGEWNVIAEAWHPRANRWYRTDSTSSSIEFAATNLIQENISYDRHFVQTKILNFSYNATAENYRVTIYNGFSSDIDVYEGGFTDTTFVVNSVNIGCDTTNTSVYRYQYGDIEDDSFILEIKSSADKGENWNPMARMSYSRKEDGGCNH